jgi:cytochrome bd ubiquinol oxidase subunit II
VDYFNLNTVWFALIAVLWLGYFFLEGFDFGVGVLLRTLGRDDLDRRVMINTVGPVWDGNEVWLLTAGGATFAAFPEWYATLFSAFYLPLFAILVALIARGVAFEFRAKHDHPRWRQAWDRAIFWGSFVPALGWGVAWANILRGIPLDRSGEYSGGLVNLLNPYALLGGLVSLGLFTLHGATFLTLKTEGEICERARLMALRLAVPVAGVVAAFLTWTWANARTGEAGIVPGAVPIAGLAAAVLVGWLVRERLAGWAFVATGLAIVATFATVFLNLYPRVLPAINDPQHSLTIFNAASTPYTLGVMTVVAVIFTPVVLLYQGWTYWVFRARISRDSLAARLRSPIDLLAGGQRSPTPEGGAGEAAVTGDS